MPHPSTPAAPDATSLDHSPDSATTALYRAAIGRVNTDYYLPIFMRFEAAERSGPSWNWAASLYTLNWMVFRRLWAAAGVYVAAMLGLFLVVLGTGRLLFPASESVEMGLLVLLGVLSFGVPGIFGNAIFHAKSRQKMAFALSSTPTLMDACAALNQQASSRQRFIGVVLANLVLAGVVALVYVAFTTMPARRVAHPAKLVMGMGPVQAMRPPPEPVPSAPDPSTAMDAVARPVSATFMVPSRPASEPAPAAATVGLVTPPVIKIAAPEPIAAPQSPASSPIAGQRYFINVGLFANGANARNAYAKLREVGLPAFTQTLKGRTRVRVGPFTTQPEADTAAQRIHGLQLDAVVFQQ